MRRLSFLPALFAVATTAFAQPDLDSLRQAHGIPAIGYAVVTADSVLELHLSGVRQAGTDRAVTRDDRFRIGSNTKTVTSLIAAVLVHQGLIQWDTRFFDLFPELRAEADPAYHALTLLDLLTFRVRLVPYTYTDSAPSPTQFTGDGDAQRKDFMRWAVQQAPVEVGDGIHFSNLAYVLAGAMLERASEKSYAQLVDGIALPLGIHFNFGAPNRADPMTTWGHRADGSLEAPADHVKLDWLMAAGNLNCSLPDLAAYAQLHLRGLQGRSQLISQAEFEYLHTGAPTWALGWRWTTDADGHIRSFHVGNPGAFLTEVFVHHASRLAYVLVANRQSPATQEALDTLYEQLVRRFEQ